MVIVAVARAKSQAKRTHVNKVNWTHSICVPMFDDAHRFAKITEMALAFTDH